MWDKIKTFYSEHPWGGAALIFVLGAVLIYFLWPRKKAAVSTAPDNSAYYNAAAASTISGNEVLANQNAITGQITEAQIASDAAVKIANIQADVTKLGLTTNQDIINQQTAAGVAVSNIAANTALGVSTLSAAVQSQQISANENIAAKTMDVSLQSQRDNFAQMSSLINQTIGAGVGGTYSLSPTTAFTIDPGNRGGPSEFAQIIGGLSPEAQVAYINMHKYIPQYG